MIKSILIDIWSSVAHHKVRSVLTGFGIAWGIFILVLLLGVSAGTEKGIMSLLKGYAQNTLWVYGGTDNSKSWNAHQVVFDDKLTDNVTQILGDAALHITREADISNYGQIIYQHKSRKYTVKAVDRSYFDIKTLTVEDGRFFNSLESQHEANVVVIGKKIKEVFWGQKSPIGKSIAIGDEYYKVIGVLKSGSVFDQGEQGSLFIPFQTGASNFHNYSQFSAFGLSLRKNVDTKKVEDRIRHYLSTQLNLEINNKEALYIFNYKEQTNVFGKLFSGLNMFFFFIGICLLLSGIIGVANIMFVVVNERTQEIGIRKAIGAKPQSIISMILIEAIAITTIAGVIGMLLGIGVLELLNLYLKNADIMIKETTVSLGVVIGALLLLITSGILAGLIPAGNAMKIKPIKAIQTL